MELTDSTIPPRCLHAEAEENRTRPTASKPTGSASASERLSARADACGDAVAKSADADRCSGIRRERLSRDGAVYTAGPMRGHSRSRYPDMASDLRSPNGI